MRATTTSYQRKGVPSRSRMRRRRYGGESSQSSGDPAQPTEKSLDRHLIEIAAYFVQVLRLIGYSDKRIVDEIVAATSRQRPARTAPATPHLGYWARVLARWAEDPRFVNDQGIPRDLRLNGPNSFTSLVEAELPGEDPRQSLRVLTGTHAITRLPDGRLRWRSRAAISGEVMNVAEVLRPLRSLLINLQAPYDARVRPFTRGVSGFSITHRDAIDLRRLIEVQGMMFLEVVDNWLRQRAVLRARVRPRKSAPPSRLVRPFVGLIMNSNGDLPTRPRVVVGRRAIRGGAQAARASVRP